MLNLFQHPTCKAACLFVGSRNKFGMTVKENILPDFRTSDFRTNKATLPDIRSIRLPD